MISDRLICYNNNLLKIIIDLVESVTWIMVAREVLNRNGISYILTSMLFSTKCSFTDWIGTFIQKWHRTVSKLGLKFKGIKENIKGLLPLSGGKCRQQEQQMHLSSQTPQKNAQECLLHCLRSPVCLQNQRWALPSPCQILSLDLKLEKN